MAGSVALLPREIHVLDLGCGNMQRIRGLAVKHPKRNFVGVDHTDWVGGLVLPPNAYFVQRDIVDFLSKLPRSNVRVANADYLIHHLQREHRAVFFRELMRVVKPGGRFYVSHYLDNKLYSVGDIIIAAKRAGFQHEVTKPLLYLHEGASHSTRTMAQSRGRASVNRFDEEIPGAPRVPTSVRITFVKPRERV
ncbi:MAG: class I SAM-dependent methyltransferase [Candidatus Micrarchaeota archaeon]